MNPKMLAAIIILALVIFSGMLFVSGEGFMFKTVLSGSMSPTFNTGDVIIISDINPDTVKEGDIITFRTGATFTTHRVVGIKNNSFITKGDANEDADIIPVQKSEIAGKVIFTIPYMGYLGRFVRSPLGFAAFILIPGILIICIEIKKIKYELDKKKWRYLYKPKEHKTS